jgi:serine/threonine protein kinase
MAGRSHSQELFMSRDFLVCLARAVVKHASRALDKNEPLGECLCDIAQDMVKEWMPDDPFPYARDALEALAGASDVEARRMAQIGAAANAPPQLVKALRAYLAQVPEAVRRAFVHSADPSGLTMPPGFRVREPSDLLRFLPLRAPRFEPGTRPVPGADWRLERLLGIGGFGEVWKATGRKAGPVALKFCFAPDAVAVLRHEKALLDQIGKQGGHPGIVRLRRAHLFMDPPCLEYEYVEAIDLARGIREWPEEPAVVRVERSVRLLSEVVDVVAAMHRLSPPVIHRDLKPANVLLKLDPRRVGQGVFITDFGIGGVAAQLASGHTQTLRGLEANLLSRLSGAFTPVYASPQQLRGEKPDPADDVHALGVLWYQMLTGDLHAPKVPPDWRVILEQAGVPPAVLDVLKRCLASKPNRRLPNAILLAEELSKLLPSQSRRPLTDDEIGAMLLALWDKAPQPKQEAPPPAPAPRKAPPSASSAAASILQKFMRRPS